MALQAISAGDPARALRYADRARRLNPEAAALAQLCARLLGRLGRPRRGLEILQDSPAADVTATHGLIRAELLLAAGAPEDAADVVEALLGLFAVEALPGVGDLAAAICSHPGCRRRGWVGFAADGRRVGAPAPDQAVDPARDPAVIGAAALRWPPAWRADGEVRLAGETIQGWVRLGWAPEAPLSIAIEGPGGEALLVPTRVDSDVEGRAIRVFSAESPSHWPAEAISVGAVLPDDRRWPIPGLRVRGAVPRGRRRPKRPTRKIAIVIPVYAGREETLVCLRSVLETTDREVAEVVAVYDCGPEPQLLAALEILRDQGLVTLLVNSENRGFPASANRGMALRPDRDVVLLNADTEVYGDWLRRLSMAAYSDPDIATVTPLSNNGSIVAYPSTDDLDVDSAHGRLLDALFAMSAETTPVDLPTGVGFCLYVKRACLAEVGEFDEAAFGPGYGEENDFCLRATAARWRHVAAVDVFVRHVGGRSFGALKGILMENNLRVLERRYPGYGRMVARFVEKDPLQAARRRADAQLIAGDRRPVTLVVTLGRDGGVRRHVEDRGRTLTAEGYRVMELRPAAEAFADGLCRLVVPGEPFADLTYRLPDEHDALLDLLATLPVARAEIHHFLGLHPAVLDIPRGLGVAYDLFVHDYSWVCPRITLTRDADGYCGEPDIADCERCVANHGSLIEEEIAVADLRARSSRLFEGAATVTVPSRDVAERLRRYFPRVETQITPWETFPQVAAPPRALSSDRARVAMIGAIGLHKGYAELLACARDAARRNLPLDFVVIGYTEDDATLFQTGRVFITGRFAEDEVAELLQREDCNVACYPSVAPETWSYALSHGLRSGLPIVAIDFGAVGERLRDVEGARLLQPGADAATLNDALIASATPRLAISVRSRGRAPAAFADGAAAGFPDDGAWIEGFRFGLPDVSYRARLANGEETSFTTPPNWCADLAGGRPLAGFAIRLEGDLAAAYRCEYSGAFSSGLSIAATEAGEMCRSPMANDPLVAIRARLVRVGT